MVPMHYAGDQAKGVRYTLSFSVGAVVVTAAVWLARAAWERLRRGSWAEVRRALPPLHLRRMALPGGAAGFLWSVGNLGSMVSVQYLGEAIGYSVIQGQMLVSGTWGIFWFREIKNEEYVFKWFAAAVVTMTGIVLLTFQYDGNSVG